MKFYRVSALMLKYWYITINRLDRIFDIVYWPVINLFLWGFTTFFVQSLTDTKIIGYFIGGAILWVFVWRSTQDISVYILEDFWSRNLYNLFVTPIRSSELILSVILFGLIRSVLTFFLLVLIAIVLYSFNLFTIGVLPVVLLTVSLILTGWALGLFISSMIFRYGMRIQVFAWSLPFLLQPFSCIFYPLSALPPIAQKIALMLPTTYIFESFRAMLDNGVILWNYIVISYILNIIAIVIASILFGRSIIKAKKIGLLTRNE